MGKNHEGFAKEFKKFFNVYLKHNLSKKEKKIAATSDFTFYQDGIRGMSNGELFGVIAHEIAHSVDDTLGDKSQKKQVIAKITDEHNLQIKPEDYAKWGEAELFADLMAMDFYAKLDSSNRNEIIEDYAIRRKLRKELYEPFMKGAVIERGSSLERPIVINQLPEEYTYIENQLCPNCSDKFDESKLQRKSWVIYANRVHDVLRCHCSKCGKKTDFYFDYTNTFPVSEQMISDFIARMKSTHGEVTDPTQNIFFD